MDVLQAASAAVALVDICIRLTRFVIEAQENARSAKNELETVLKEVASLQKVSGLIGSLEDIFKDFDVNQQSEHIQRVRDLDFGAKLVITECKSYADKIKEIVDVIHRPSSGIDLGRIDSIKLMMRKRKWKDDLEQQRANIHSGQVRLQAFYTAFNIMQVKCTGDSVRGDVRRLGFELKQHIAQIRAGYSTDFALGHDYLSPMAGVLGSITLNEHFDVPRSVGSFFTGRQDLLEGLKSAYTDPAEETTPSPKIFIIHGFPGSGKTDFAYKFAEQYRESFWGIFVLQADSQELIENSFRRIVQFSDKKIEPNVAAAKHWLANQRLPWLLVLDNADDADLDIRQYFPASPSGCILITTRNRDLRVHGNVGTKFLNFERLTHNEAKTVLLRSAEEPSPTRPSVNFAAGKISDELQCLPLALVTAGRTIREHLCTWNSYLNWYRRNCDLISRQLSSGKGLAEVEQAKLTVIPTLEPHFQRLERLIDQTSIDATGLIHTLGYFHHSKISFKLLKLVAKNANKIALSTNSDDANPGDTSQMMVRLKAMLMENVGEAAMKMVTGPPPLPGVLKNVTVDSLDEDRLRAALRKLESLNLIRCDNADKAGSQSVSEKLGEKNNNSSGDNGNDDSSDCDEIDYHYSLHPLVHSWIRQRHSKAGERAIWCAAAITAISQCIVLEVEAFTGPTSSYFDAHEILPHLDQARKCKEEIDQELATRSSGSSWVRRLLGLIWQIPREPCMMSQRNEALISVKSSLVYSLCGEFQRAAELQSSVRSFVVKHRGMNAPVSIYLTQALASTMQKLTKFDQATDLQTQVLKACRMTYGAEHPRSLTMADQLGLLLLYEGRIHEGYDLHQEALKGLEQLGSKYCRQVCIVKAHLASACLKLLRFDQAKTLCEQAIAGLEELDPQDEETLWAKEVLAMVYGELDEAATAVELTDEVYRKRADKLGKQHPYTLWAAVNRSRALMKTQRYEEALGFLDDARMIAATTLGEKHFGYLAADTLRACILKEKGDLDEAEAWFKSLDSRYEELKREKGKDHADRIIMLSHQLDLYEEQESLSKAERVGEQILEILRSVNKDKGWRHPLRPRVESKLAHLRAQQAGSGIQGSTIPHNTSWKLMDFRAAQPVVIDDQLAGI